MKLEELEKEIISLKKDEFESLLIFMLNLSRNDTPAKDEPWLEEVEKRYQELISGKVKGIGIDELKQKTKSILG
ncbi:MAG: hypothetical protein SFU91_02290 [Chloroherpetonaceae bacterium]|nr:hypothetical protein [Chloroherpetonaceae bacterium]